MAFPVNINHYFIKMIANSANGKTTQASAPTSVVPVQSDKQGNK